MKEKYVDNLSSLLKSISHPTRLKILCLLQDGEMAVGEIREALQTTNANVSQHLTILRNQGIVGSRKEANFIYNRIVDERVVTLIGFLEKQYCSY